ncbi:hypothetical protein [Mycobacteroides abscessus]|uniref:hypothetical protein n=1 Tax=Mycobacteroides abscessus TaxID=36809 RepID=UPI0009A8E89A|nr:hypothetical protein [Mycobacteroides abscessus]
MRRRLTRPAKRPGGRGIVARSVNVLATGTRTNAEAFLTAMPGHRHVAAPAGVEAKQRSSFEQWWSHATSQTSF